MNTLNFYKLLSGQGASSILSTSFQWNPLPLYLLPQLSLNTYYYELLHCAAKDQEIRK